MLTDPIAEFLAKATAAVQAAETPESYRFARKRMLSAMLASLEAQAAAWGM